MSILTTCLNAALDITYAVDRLEPGETHRVGAVTSRAGGKGINVARVLHELGEPVRVAAFLGGATGEAIRVDLESAGIPLSVSPTAAPSRRTVAVVDDRGTATVLTEPGGPVSPEEWDLMRASGEDALDEVGVSVLSGSLPSGVPRDAYAVLCSSALRRGVPVIVDAEGPALLAAAEAGASILKPNIHELLATLDCAGPAEGARLLRERGAGAVVVSLGAEGVLGHDADGMWRARLPQALTGNPTGAGDALVAALARGLAEDRDWPAMLRDGVALSAAAVLHPVAGGYDADAYERFTPLVTLEEIR